MTQTASTALRPREHGAYAMLAFPMLSGLAVGGFSWPGVAFALLVGSGFLAHEAFSVVRGTRGERLRAGYAGDARRRLLGLGVVALVSAATFWVTAPSGARSAALVTAALAVPVLALLAFGRTKSLAGELWVGLTFASVHAVVAGAGGAAPDAARLPVLAWIVSFTLATLAVHALKARFKGGGPGRWTVMVAPALAAVVLLASLTAVTRGALTPGFAMALAPKALVVLLLAGWAVHPRHLKRVGWSYVAADTVTLILLAAVLSAL